MSKCKYSIHSEPLQTSTTKHFANVSGGVLKNICSKRFISIIPKTSGAEFIFSIVPCFQRILFNTFRKMLLKFDNNSLRDIFF